MAEIWPLALALVAGAELGLLFFGGLWLTVRALRRTQHPVIVTVTSFWVRAALLAGGLFLIVSVGGEWPHLVAALVGLTVVRVVLVRRLGPGRPGEPGEPGAQGT